MRWPTLFALCAAAAVAFISAAQSPTTSSPTTPSKEVVVVEGKGLPPRANAADYSAHVQVGTIAIGADFTGHNVDTQDGILTTEDYVVIEAGVFGPPDSKLNLSIDDFSLRINGRKAVPRQPYELIGKSLKDPDYVEPETNKASKTIMTGAGKQDGADPNAPPPALVPIPFEIRRGWQLRLKRDSLTIGERALPQAGLLLFPYGGGPKSIKSIELIYSGPAGKATLPIHP